MDGGIMMATADGIDHGKSILTDCLWAVVEKYEDGYMLCPLLETGGTCDECMMAFERGLQYE